MNQRLKDIFFSDFFINQLADAILQEYPQFDRQRFVQQVLDEQWEDLELKQKMRHMTSCLHENLPGDYPHALDILRRVSSKFDGFDALVFSDYVECYGLDHWDLSLPALEAFTKIVSAEFAIRPFLVQDPERAMRVMETWAENEDPNVRRLSSEGCRPRLPWAMALPAFKSDPGPILKVLEKLKQDPSESVRKSVANNLNDISKDHPDLVLDVCQRWYGTSEETDWIVKHACRTLLKAGNERAMLLFGFGETSDIHVEQFTLDPDRLPIGESTCLSFDLRLATDRACKVRLEYVVDFARASGKKSRKVFQIREGTYEPGTHTITRTHAFADLSTRSHFPGEHNFTLVVNGREKASASVMLTDPQDKRI